MNGFNRNFGSISLTESGNTFLFILNQEKRKMGKIWSKGTNQKKGSCLSSSAQLPVMS